MTGRDLPDPDAHGRVGGEEEHELRHLLQRAVPDLAAPEDRMERIRARAARTRSRRRAATIGSALTGGLVAAALLAAPAVAPAPERGATAAPAGTPSAVSSVPPAPTGRPPGDVVPPGTGTRFPALPDLVVEVPDGWHSRDGITGDPRDGIGFLATEPLDSRQSCPPEIGVCIPIGPLAADGAFLGLQLVDDQSRIQQAPGGPATLTDEPPEPFCRTQGGTRTIIGRRVISRDGVPALIEVTACLRQPSDRTVQQVRDVLDSIRTTGNGSPPAKAPRG
ncbi:hypothetical protein [Kitasatospora sp. NPDC005856]|uniref:hypothetical protein n=1 Tax=Kitasatospora sp. NPDC005856 TaxID=3154566 RepID=UPI0034068927